LNEGGGKSEQVPSPGEATSEPVDGKGEACTQNYWMEKNRGGAEGSCASWGGGGLYCECGFGVWKKPTKKLGIKTRDVRRMGSSVTAKKTDFQIFTEREGEEQIKVSEWGGF